VLGVALPLDWLPLPKKKEPKDEVEMRRNRCLCR